MTLSNGSGQTANGSNGSLHIEEWPLLTPDHKLSDREAHDAIEALQSIIQFKTVSATGPTTGEYTKCAEWLVGKLESIGCLDKIHFLEESPANCPVVIARWKGTAEEELPVILLNSHYDVVPADPLSWTVPPFEGLIKDGKIYGRGAQDMKCVCIQYIEAIRKLHSIGFQPTRDVYLSFVPDEENGGAGMAALLASSLYKSFTKGIALALDEGLASPTNTMSVFYGERLPWWVEVKAEGQTGHGSRFIEHTAVEMLVELCNKALAFRKGQRAVLHGMDDHEHANCSHAVAAAKRAPKTPRALGDVTSINITTLQAGVRVGDTYASNVVPPRAIATLDIRISPHMPPSEMKEILDSWCQECATEKGSMSWSFAEGHGNDDTIGHSTTDIDKKINPWYGIFAKAMEEMKVDFSPEVFPAATDSRFLRALGVRALGFSPMRNSEIMLHENDEYIDQSVFLEGVGVLTGIIQSLAMQGPEIDALAKKAE